MSNRLELQAQLESLLGSQNVYFQPPENIKLRYPCIIYSLSRPVVKKADDGNYYKRNLYNLTLIFKDPDSDLPDKILEGFSYCSFDRSFVNDNLYHNTFSLYY